ncbi:hypothetical protein X975_19936, partial [Stegodyphus mimosarum]
MHFVWQSLDLDDEKLLLELNEDLLVLCIEAMCLIRNIKQFGKNIDQSKFQLHNTVCLLLSDSKMKTLHWLQSLKYL